MDEDANSWLRRTKFPHTVFHRLDSTRLAATSPFTVQRKDQLPGMKTRAVSTSVLDDQKPKPQVKTGPVRQMSAPIKQRSLSPSPFSITSETFKEAQLDKKRFLTPHPRRTESMGKLIRKDSHQTNMVTSQSSSQLNTSTSLKTPMKLHEKTKSGKESAWTKFFDHGGGKVNAIETAEEWKVDPSQLFLGQRFAHGAHSQIYHGSYKEEPVAVKIIRVPDDDENGAMAVRLENQFKREVTLLSRLHHPNIIKFVASWRTPPVFCIITEYLSEGSLRAYLHKLEHKALDLPNVIGIALDIARGMEFIHSQGVIHRDLKPENILIDPEFHMKIADFGIACEESYCDSLDNDPGTFRWMAPEMIKRKPYGRKVDVYSFGLILFEMVTGTIPYGDMMPIQAAFAVMYKKLRPAIPVNCPPAMRAFIEQCWCRKAEKRPEFWQVVKVLEQFESSLAKDGTLTLVENHPICKVHKKRLLHWIHKLGTEHHPNGGGGGTMVPKPKFT